MSRTILLADDSLTIQKVVELTFADTDYDVISLSSGDDLLQRLDEVSPDLVICDIIMPGRDGYDVCQEIKSDPGTLHIPVILLSGTFEPFDRDRALAAGCSEIITKPFEARKLVDTVERLLVGDVSGTAAAAEEPPTPPAEVPAAPDPNTQTLESFPVQADELEPAAAESPDIEELPESSLDFTDTGFAEMEEAALQGQQQRSEMPEDGIEFEFSDEHEAFGTPDTAESSELLDARAEFDAETSAEAAPEVDAFAESKTTSEDETLGDDREVPEVDHVAEVVAEPSEVETTEPTEPEFEAAEGPSFEVPDAAEGAPDIEGGEPFPAAQTADEIADAAVADREPFTSDDADEETDGYFEVSPETVEIPRTDLPIDETTDVEPVQEAERENEVGVDVEFVREIEAEPDHEPDVGPDVESHTPVDAARGEGAAAPGADTGPVPAELLPEREEQVTEEPFSQPESVPPASLAEMGGLSDEDIDRIARRVLELASDRFEQLAWEIVPDMAEIAVRQRIRELEKEIEGSSEDDPR
jgi:CheY-like chemotaxis protein